MKRHAELTANVNLFGFATLIHFVFYFDNVKLCLYFVSNSLKSVSSTKEDVSKVFSFCAIGCRFSTIEK